MGDGLVAGRLYAAGQCFGWMYRAFLHAGILAWGLRTKEFRHRGTESAAGVRVRKKTCPFIELLAAQQRARRLKFPGTRFVLSSAGEILMSARSSIVHIVAKVGMLLGALFLFTLLLAALPAHRAPVQERARDSGDRLVNLSKRENLIRHQGLSSLHPIAAVVDAVPPSRLGIRAVAQVRISQ